MRRFSLGLIVAAVAAVALIGAGPPARAADSPLAGKWKVTLQLRYEQYTLWLVKIEEKGGKPKATLLSTGEPNFKDSKIDSFGVDAKKVEISFAAGRIGTFPVTLYLPSGTEKAPKKLLGSTTFRGQRLYAWLEKTDMDELDPKKSTVRSPSLMALQKAFQMKDGDEKIKALNEVEAKFADDPFAQLATMQILGMMAKQENVKDADITAQSEKAIKYAAQYGPEMKLQAIGQVAGQLAGSKKTANVAVTYARQAEKALGPKAAYDEKVPVLTTLASALRNAGQEAEANKIETTIDQEFLKNAVPFKPDKYAGRASKSNRIVVVELFTGAQCPPCVAADIAFDAMLERYKPTDVVLLQYHLHIPGPDPLTNKDTEARAEYYAVQGTPSLYIDGKTGPPAGGFRPNAKDTYSTVHKAVDKQIEETAGGKLKLNATRKGDKIEITADIADLQKTGENVRLRFVLVEDRVKFVGRNGQRFHHHVVRALPGGEKGFALEKKAGKQTVTVSLKELTKTLAAYLKEKRFAAKDQPLDLKSLKVVALIQDAESKDILQAAQVDLEESKESS